METVLTVLNVEQDITLLQQHSHANNVVHYVLTVLAVLKTIVLVAPQVLFFKMVCVNKIVQLYTTPISI